MKIHPKNLKNLIKESVKKLITETGEWAGDEEDQIWMDAFKEDLDVIEKELGDKFVVYDVKGFDKYQGPYANVRIGDGSYQVWTIENDPAEGRNFILWIDGYPVDNTSMLDKQPGFQGTTDEIIELLTKSPTSELDKEEIKEEEVAGAENFEDVEVWDNGGTTFDRYTVFIGDSVYGMSHNPNSPQGFNQFLGDTSEVEKGRHLGTKLESVPDEIKDAVLARKETLNENLKNNIDMKIMKVSELKKFIKEEAEKLHKVTLLKEEKANIDKELLILKEGVKK